MAPENDRLRHIDGLRGLAVLMVVLFHVDTSVAHQGLLPVHWLLSEGSLGVSLFLVLSGFCLSYPPLVKRRNGVRDWFVPSRFFASRIIRILPPYYAALAFFTATVMVAGPLPCMVGTGNFLGDLVSHILLIHNLTGSYDAFNGSFWSLALEWQWQWYFTFPLFLVLVTRRPLPTLTACLILAVGTHLAYPDVTSTWWSVAEGTLPARLVEFVTGIGVAWVIASDMRMRNIRAAVVGAVALVVCLLIRPIAADPLHALVFGGLVLVTCKLGWAQSRFGSAPLVRLGMASYSIYLVHQPIALGAISWLPLPLDFPREIVTVAIATTAGFVFHNLVEARCTTPSFRQRWMPPLQRIIAPVDHLMDLAGPRGLNDEPLPTAPRRPVAPLLEAQLSLSTYPPYNACPARSQKQSTEAKPAARSQSS